MAIERAREYLKAWNLEDKILEFKESSATVELAAKAAGCEPARIAKSISLKNAAGSAILVVAAGDVKIDNKKFKAYFGVKPKMLSFEEVEPLIGHAVGGVCPFGINDGVAVYLDESLKRFPSVFPACGSANSAIELAHEQFFEVAKAIDWVDVTKEA